MSDIEIPQAKKTTKKVSDYKQGKIYAIRSHKTPYYYIGSTTEPRLSGRLCRHRSDWKAYMELNNSKGYMYSSFIIEQGDAYIELVENFPCENKDQLKAREGHHIRTGGDMVCNHNIAGRTLTEYLVDNKEKHAEQRRIRREAKKQQALPKL
jgi:hypothetical protein